MSVADFQSAGFEPVPDQETVVLPVEPRSPQYARLPVRIASFTKWPQDITQTPEELAEAGFFYTGIVDFWILVNTFFVIIFLAFAFLTLHFGCYLSDRSIQFTILQNFEDIR